MSVPEQVLSNCVFDRRPAQILAHVDAALRRRPTLSVCTALCVNLSLEQGTIAAGGHPLLLRLNDEGIGRVGSPGTLLGAFANANRPETPFTMQPGETLVAITDGVTDTVGENGERFGTERLERVLADAREQSPAAIRQRLSDALEHFQVGSQADDTAIVVMRFTGRSVK